MFTRVRVSDFAAFQELTWEAHCRLNVLVGENDTGKTHLLKLLYTVARAAEEFHLRPEAGRPRWGAVLAEKLLAVFEPRDLKLGELVRRGAAALSVETRLEDRDVFFSFGKETTNTILNVSDAPPQGVSALFLPAGEVMTAAEAMAATRERLYLTGFDDTYLDLIRAMRGQPGPGARPKRLQDVLTRLESVLDGRFVDRDGQLVFERGGRRYGISQVAQGLKKIGELARIIENRSLRQDTMLFLDEPEANLHPSAIVALAGALFDLSRAGVQVYLATHSYFMLRELELLARGNRECVPMVSLTRDGGEVRATIADLQEGMPDNPIVQVSLDQYERDIQLSAGR